MQGGSGLEAETVHGLGPRALPPLISEVAPLWLPAQRIRTVAAVAAVVAVVAAARGSATIKAVVAAVAVAAAGEKLEQHTVLG